MSVIQDNSITSNNIQPASGQALTIKDEGGTSSITVATNGEATFAENIIVGTAGKGINFSAQTASSSATAQSSEILDHYEFGTWAPNSIDGGSSHAPTTRVGYYVRIGNHVTVKGKIDGFQNNSSTNTFTIGNLPFTSGANQNIVSGAATASEHNFGDGLVAIVNASDTSVYFVNVGTGDAGNTALKFANFWSTGATVQFVAQYQTDY